MTTIKLCKDCKYFERSWLIFSNGQFDKCTRSEHKSPNLVIGGVMKSEKKFCTIERDYSCGTGAKFFEAKK
jgi:hypothetical protein